MNYDDLLKKESMKYHLKQPKVWDVYPYPFKPKKNNPYIRDWYWSKGKKYSSHSWGRKPSWRMKRREQRRGRGLTPPPFLDWNDTNEDRLCFRFTCEPLDVLDTKSIEVGEPDPGFHSKID